MTLRDLQDRVDQLTRDRAGLTQALGRALLNGEKDVRRHHERLAENARALAEVEAMVGAFAQWKRDIQEAAADRMQARRPAAVPLKKYNDERNSFLADYDRHRGDRKALLPRAKALRALAQSCGQVAVNDCQRRFNGLGALPELHSK